MEKILLAQFIAHIVADFFVQHESVSRKKQQYLFYSRHIYIHVLIVFAVSLAMTFMWEFVLWAGTIAISHFIIDALRCRVEQSIKKKRKIADEEHYYNHYIFFIDQIAHLIVIYLVVRFYWKICGCVPSYFDCFTVSGLLMAICLLLCMKPANVVIKVCLLSLKKTNRAIDRVFEGENLPKAGHWLGFIERLSIFVFFVLGNYIVLGIIVGAKSLLKFHDRKNIEYVIVGTMMSYGIALALGVGITSGVFESIINVISCN